MSVHNIRQPQVLRYADIQNTARHDLRVAEREFRATVTPIRPATLPQPPSWSERLDAWFHRGGWLLMGMVILAVIALSACGEFRARPDLKVSTLTQSSVACVHGHRTEQVGTMGLYGTPVVLVTAERCEVKP